MSRVILSATVSRLRHGDHPAITEAEAKAILVANDFARYFEWMNVSCARVEFLDTGYVKLEFTDDAGGMHESGGWGLLSAVEKAWSVLDEKAAQ